MSRQWSMRCALVGLIGFCCGTNALGQPATAPPPALQGYEMTKLDLRGDVTRDIAIHPTNPAIVYIIGQNGGVYKSTDSGKNWKQVLATDGRGVAINHQNPETIYAGGFSGVHKSTDGGKTWKQVLKGALRSMGVHPVSGVIFGGGNGGQVFRSDDGGVTWTEPPRSGDGEINKWAFHPTDANICYHSAAKNRGIYKSIDAGKTWKRATEEYGRCVAISQSNPNILYGSRSMSTDGGETWKPTGGGSAWAVAIHPKDANIVYKATQGDGVFMTTDGGKNWRLMNGCVRGGPTDLVALWSIAIDGTNDILYAGAAVLYRAENARSLETELKESSQGYSFANCYSLAGNKDEIWAGTDGQGVVRSRDRGASWQRKLLGLGGKLNLGSVRISAADPRIICGAAEGGWVRSTTGGELWMVMPGPAGGVANLTLDRKDPAIVYIVSRDKGPGNLYISRDGGITWAAWEALKDHSVRQLVIHPNDPAIMLASTETGWLRSTDAGRSWQPIKTPADGSIAPSSDPKTPTTYYFVESRQGLWKSPDGGKTWEKIYSGSGMRGRMADAPGGRIWLEDGQNLVHSADGGKIWQSLAMSSAIRALLPDPNDPQSIFVGCTAGAFWIHPAGRQLPPAIAETKPTSAEPKTIQISAGGLLDRPNTTYVLTKPISCFGGAFFVNADNVTLDCKGYEVTFDVNAVRAVRANHLTIKNAAFKQSGERASSHVENHGIDLIHCDDATVSNVSIDVVHRGTSGIEIHGRNARVTGNKILKLGPFGNGIVIKGPGAVAEGNEVASGNQTRGVTIQP